MKILVVVNPRAGSGRAVQTGDALCRALAERRIAFERVDSLAASDATRLARSARTRDATVVAAVGGDGTFNEVAQALIDEHGNPAEGPDLCLVPAGTASDLGRTLGLESDVARVVDRIEKEPRRMDLGVVSFTERDGRGVAARAFLNVASVGLSAVVADRSNRFPKWLGGRLTYLFASLVSALGYRNAPLRVVMDGARIHEGPVTLVAFCNGRFFGGAMQIAPSADASDGRLECVVLGDLGKIQTYALTSHIYAGTHVSQHGVAVSRGSEFEIECIVPERLVEIEIDGETPGVLPARIRVVANAVGLRC